MTSDRGGQSGSGEKQALFQILIEMNQLQEPRFEFVHVIVATNAPQDLDRAIKRRFSFVYVPLPSQEERIELFQYYLNKNHTLKDKHFQYLAEKTDGFSSSDIEKIVSTCACFYYQEMYSRENVKDDEKLGREIFFEELKSVVDNSEPSTEEHDLIDDEDFAEKHNLIMFSDIPKTKKWKPENKVSIPPAKVHAKPPAKHQIPEIPSTNAFDQGSAHSSATTKAPVPNLRKRKAKNANNAAKAKKSKNSCWIF